MIKEVMTWAHLLFRNGIFGQFDRQLYHFYNTKRTNYPIKRQNKSVIFNLPNPGSEKTLLHGKIHCDVIGVT